MSRLTRVAPAALVALTFAAAPARAQEKRSDTLLTVDHYLDFESVADPRISPDGARVVYTRRWVNKLEDRFDTELWIMNADGSQNRRLAKGASPVWSPDGTRIAYLADGEPRGTQLFVRWMSGDADGAASQITRVDEAPTNVKWSPDGRSLGFTMFVPKTTAWKIDLPEAPKGAKWTPAPRIVQSLHYRQDRRGFTDPGFRHLFVVPADGGTPRQITKGDWSVGARFDALDQGAGWDWLADGRRIVFDGLADTTWDANYHASNLYVVDVATGALRTLTTEPGIWSAPVVSPDGRRIAYLGHTRLTDSYHAADVWVMDADGANRRDLSPALDRDPGAVVWSPDAAGVYFNVDDRGTRQLYYAAVAGGEPKALTSGDHVVSLVSLARNGTAVGTRASYREPGDVVRIDLRRAAAITRLTAVNDELLGRIRLGDVERIRYASGQTQVDGWIVKPPGFDSTRKYPLLMEIHGGPHSAYTATFSYQFQNFAANGFVVLYTNPRGSTSYGSAFGNAIQHAYPSVDYDDLMAGVDAVVRRGFVDTTAMYVGGCSGGGVLSSWVIGHTNRFAAAAVRCPVINWMSMAGETDIPYFTYNFFAKPFWEDPKPWLERSSLMYVGNVTTPTIVMTGELDRRTPMPQSEEYYAALRMRGVPTSLLRFEGEFHGTGSKPSNFMRTQLYMMSWYKRWTRAAGGAVSLAGATVP